MTEPRDREKLIETHVRWLELCLQDARELAQSVVDGTDGRVDAKDFLESTRGFQVGEAWGHERTTT